MAEEDVEMNVVEEQEAEENEGEPINREISEVPNRKDKENNETERGHKT